MGKGTTGGESGHNGGGGVQACLISNIWGHPPLTPTVPILLVTGMLNANGRALVSDVVRVEYTQQHGLPNGLHKAVNLARAHGGSVFQAQVAYVGLGAIRKQRLVLLPPVPVRWVRCAHKNGG